MAGGREKSWDYCAHAETATHKKDDAMRHLCETDITSYLCNA